MERKKFLMLVVLTGLFLSACSSNVPDYRDDEAGNEKPTDQEMVEDVDSQEEIPDDEEVSEDTTNESNYPEPSIKVEPTMDYSKYSDATELEIIMNREGTGDRQSAEGDQIYVHYVGFLPNGEMFDNSVERGTPFNFTLGSGGVIDGWEEGLLGKKVGDVFTLVIPFDKGYGENGSGAIPPKSNLIFEIEVMDIQNGKEA